MDKVAKTNLAELQRVMGVVRDNPDKYEFDMYHFRGFSDGRVYWFFSHDDCGSCGCALGSLALLGEGQTRPQASEFQVEIDSKRKRLSFPMYCRRLFKMEDNEWQWRFLFSPEWMHFDNTPQGVIDRIDFYLANEEKIEDGNWSRLDFLEGWKK